VAITEDASTPAIIQQTGSGVSTTASFSPPSSSLLVALVSGGWGNTALMTAAVTDSTGGTWTAAATAAGTNTGLRGIAAVFYRYLPTAPGAMTVSATFTGLQGGRELAVRVLNGAASSQAGAGAGSQVNGTATTAGTVSVTTTVAGSVVYGIADNPNANNAYTPNAATSVLTGTPTGVFADATDSIRLVAWKATNVTVTPGATTLGGTWTAAANSNIAAFEVIPQTVTVFQGAVSLPSIAALSINATVSGPPKVTMASVATFSVIPFVPPPPAFPTIPRVIVVELFVNGGWVDISSDVYVRNSIVIKRGRADEQSRSAPSSCQLTIDNRSGNYSPRNPMGLYYGSLGRNTPIRVSVRLATDTFTRSTASGWGASDTGYAYTLVGGTGSTNGSQAVLSFPGAGTRTGIMSMLSLQDVDVSAFGTLPFDLPTGNNIIPVLVRFRYHSATDHVFAWARVETTGAVTAGITGGTGTPIIAPATTVPGLTFSAAAGLNIRAQAEGQTFRVKVWAGNAPEPYAWTSTGNSTVNMTAGLVGLGASVSSGVTNTLPIVVTLDNLVIRVPRFTGEVSSWPQRWDLSGNDVYVPIEGAGIKRRLVQQAPLRSPLRRFHDQLALPPAAYWPCEDLKSSLIFAPVVGQIPLVPTFVISDPVTPSNLNDRWVSFGNYSAYPGSSPLPTLPVRSSTVVTSGIFSPWITQGDAIGGIFLPPTVPTGQTMFRFLMTITKDQSAESSNNINIGNISVVQPVGPSASVQVTYHTGGFIGVRAFTSAGTQLYDSGAISFGGDIRDRDLLYSFQLTQSGANTLYTLSLLEVGATFWRNFSGTIPNLAISYVYAVDLNVSSGLTEFHCGHVSVRLENVGTTTGEIYGPLNAWSGPYQEAAGTRFSRLCTEETVPLYYRGDLTQTTVMGPQGSGAVTGGTSNSASLTQISGTQTLLDLLYEIEDADLGMLYEPRGDSGLEYRTRRDLYSQSPTLSLDYSQGQVAPPLEPVDDDQRTRNNIVVSQPSGQSAEAELIAGSMSSLDPSHGGVGNYNAQYTINATVDALADTATFLLSLGTVDEARYPSITVNLANPNTATAALEPSVLAVNMGDLIAITNPKTGVTFDTIRQVVQGYTETLDVFQHTITFNTSPETPYRLAQVSATPAYKVDTSTSTLASGYSTTAVSVSVNNVNEPWTTDPAQMPIPIVIAGELINVTAVSGTGSPQTFTVTRSVNGVVKPQLAGASVQIARAQRPFIAF
jgi:hypothetical protein